MSGMMKLSWFGLFWMISAFGHSTDLSTFAQYVKNKSTGISGSVVLAKGVNKPSSLNHESALFIIAYKTHGGKGPPYAVKKITVNEKTRFPIAFHVGPSDIMMGDGGDFEGPFRLKAR